MSDTSMGPGWWVASDGKWYPPREADESPAPGWWLASDGKWYPPREAEDPPAPGWWLASDGKWYPPDDESPATDTPDDVTAATPAEVIEPEPAPEPEPDSPPATAAAAAPALATAAAAPASSTVRAEAVAPPRANAPVGPPVDASEQIRRRNQASREDAVAQFPARFLAAARAVQVLESELGRSTDLAREPVHHERKGRARAEARAAEAKAVAAKAADATSTKPTKSKSTNGAATSATSTAPAASPIAEPTDAPPPSSEPATPQDLVPEPPPAPPPEPPATVPVGRPTARPGDRDGWPAPRPANGAPSTPPVGQPGGPLIELRPSPLGADIDHLGDRLLVFADRVELRDRADHVRQVVAGTDIADVAVQRKFTGAVLTIVGHDGGSIVVKGIKPEQADEVLRLIHTRLRHPADAVEGNGASAGNGAEDPSTDADADDDTPPEESALAAPSPDAVSAAADRLAILNRSRLNEADLLRKLADLHRAGVLSDAEFADKIALVGRLVSGETMVVV